METPFPDTWWTYDITSETMHRFAFDVRKQTVTAALLGRYTFGVQDEWRDYEAPVSEETAERLGVSVDEAFIYIQVIYPVRLAIVHTDAGKKVNRAEMASLLAARDLDSLDAEGVRRAVRIFLSAYADARPGTLAHYLNATDSPFISMSDAIKCWEAGVPLENAVEELSRFGDHAADVLILAQQGVPKEYAEALLDAGAASDRVKDLSGRNIPLEYAVPLLQAGASPEQIVDLWRQDIALEFALATMG